MALMIISSVDISIEMTPLSPSIYTYIVDTNREW